MVKRLVVFLVSAILFSSTFATQPLQKLTVILDWYPNPDHAPLIIAQQLGFFKAEGLDVTFISPTDPNDAPKLVAAQKADIGITYEPTFLEEVDQGLPLIDIGTLIDHPLNCLVVNNASGIHTLQDLKGKRIASTSNGLSGIMIQTMLEKQGLKPADVQYINVHYNLVQALLSHHVDAATGLMRNVEVPELKAFGAAITPYFPEQYGVPNYSELIFISHINNKNDTRFPRFLAALQQAVNAIHAHPETTWQTFSKAYPAANNEMNHRIWFATMPYFATYPANINTKDWLAFAHFMYDHQLIKHIQPLSRYLARHSE